MGRKICVCLLALCLLTGCSALLERTYSTAEPHSSKFWESEAAGTLRAENHQDVVNDLLLLVGQHRETATLRLYDFDSGLDVADTLEQAAAEVQQETPLGAYAVEYITTSSHSQRGYYEIAVRIGYRRTLDQLQALVNATSPEALYSLLAGALDEGKTELAVRMGYWGEDGQTRVQDAVAQLREERELTETVPWVINYYPGIENPGLVEFLLDPPEAEETDPEAPDQTPEEGELPADAGPSENGEDAMPPGDGEHAGDAGPDGEPPQESDPGTALPEEDGAPAESPSEEPEEN